MIKLRMIIEDKAKIKEKLPSKKSFSVPRQGEHITYLQRDFKVVEVAWDLETEEPEAVLFLHETNAR